MKDKLDEVQEKMRVFANDPSRGPNQNNWSETDLQKWDELEKEKSLTIPVIVDKKRGT